MIVCEVGLWQACRSHIHSLHVSALCGTVATRGALRVGRSTALLAARKSFSTQSLAPSTKADRQLRRALARRMPFDVASRCLGSERQLRRRRFP